MPTKRQIKEEVALIARTIYSGGMVSMYEGSVSARLDSMVFITPKLQSKETLTADMIVEADMQGNMNCDSTPYRPSSDLKMHLEAYGVRHDAAAVVHTHSPFATAFAVCGKGIETVGSPETLSIHGEVPCLPYGTPGTDAVYALFEKYLPDFNTLLLANHGLIAVGADLVQAFSRAEGIESLARTLLLARMCGGEVPLPAEEVAFLHDRRKKRMQEAKDKACAIFAERDSRHSL
jgi:L-fuculose-phosphate aldolase